jgi:hypothetical protein
VGVPSACQQKDALARFSDACSFMCIRGPIRFSPDIPLVVPVIAAPTGFAPKQFCIPSEN